MDLGIHGKRALVTGGSAGIGLAAARELAREGVDVAIIGRDENRLWTAAAVLQSVSSGKVVPIRADCGNPIDVAQSVDTAITALGSIDILVNNAGETPMANIDQAADATWECSIALKLMGYVRYARALAPAMRMRRWGRIVNVIGRSGYHPQPGYIIGSTINAALLGLTKVLAAEFAKDNVLVNGVNPGPIATERWMAVTAQRAALERTDRESINVRAIAGIPVGRLGTPEEVAILIALLCSERASFISGALINVDGGATPCI